MIVCGVIVCSDACLEMQAVLATETCPGIVLHTSPKELALNLVMTLFICDEIGCISTAFDELIIETDVSD